MKIFQFQQKKQRNYFEGWYTRITDTDRNINYAIIFAITSNEEDPHAFIQIYDGVKKNNTYLRFDTVDFQAEKDTIRIGENILSIEKLYIKHNELELSVAFKKQAFLKPYLGFQSAMSYMSLLPLVCFQEIIFHEALFSGIYKNGTETYRIKGKSYMEKTYGHRFPTKWIWIQCNHFDVDLSLSVGLGLIPLFGKLRKGYFGIINYNQKDYRFGIYNRSKVSISNEGNTILKFKKRSLTLEIEVQNQNPVLLVGPSDKAKMNLDVFESINATCNVVLKQKGKTIVNAKGTYVGFENMY